MVKRIPWSLIPFVLSMFIVVLALKESGIVDALSHLLLSIDQVFSYGYSSLIAANLINNIPMAVLYSTLLEGAGISAVYAVILASNIAAYLTPVGALAGIMFLNLTEKHGIRIRFFQFVKYGALISLASATAGFIVLRFLPV